MVRKITFINCLILSLFLHSSLVGSSYVDWNLKLQWEGLKAYAGQMSERLSTKGNEGKAVNKTEIISQEIKGNLSEVLSALKEGKKLRISPKNQAWKEYDKQQQEQKLAQKKQEEQGKYHGAGGEFLPPPKPEPIKVSLISVPKPVETEIDKGIVKIVQSIDEAACNESTSKFFGGIGLEFAPQINGSAIIKKVPAGYPASLAGIEVGDVVTGDYMRFRGEPGTYVNVDIVRNNKPISFRVKRVKVCYQEKPLDLNNPLIQPK